MKSSVDPVSQCISNGEFYGISHSYILLFKSMIQSEKSEITYDVVLLFEKTPWISSDFLKLTFRVNLEDTLSG